MKKIERPEPQYIEESNVRVLFWEPRAGRHWCPSGEMDVVNVNTRPLHVDNIMARMRFVLKYSRDSRYDH